jgi:hypothetical protein
MNGRLAFLTVLLGVAVLAAGAVPAFTADSGSVVATVNVGAPPAPCLTLSTSAVDFGTLPFSDPAAASTPTERASPSVHVASCSTAPEVVWLGANDATTASGGTWGIPGGLNSENTCSLGPNLYLPSYATSSPFLGAGRLYRSWVSLPTFAPNAGTDLTFQIQMPCQGSVGAGETASMTFTVAATIA